MEPNCPLCGSTEETITHVVLDCNIVKQVWVATGAASIFTGQHFNSWLDNLLNSMNLSVCNWYVVLIWFVWNARNDTVWNGKPFVPGCVVNAARSNMHDWNNAMAKSSCKHVTTVSSPGSDLTFKKCFVDATLFTDKNLAEVGMDLLNEERYVIAAKAGPLQCTMGHWALTMWR